MQILINLAVLAVALAVVATLACIAAGRGWAMKSVRPLAVPPVAYIENATADAVVDVIYPAMTYRKGYTEFKADNLPRQGRVEYISPRGWATLMLLLNADKHPLYRESFWILKR